MAPFTGVFSESSFASSTNNVTTFWNLRIFQRETIIVSGLFRINDRALNTLSPVIWQGVCPGHPVHTPEPGSELAVWARKHRPAHRLQVQHRCDDNRRGPQQCAVPRPHRRRGNQAPGCAPPSSLVRSPNPLRLPKELLLDKGIIGPLAWVFPSWRSLQACVSEFREGNRN